MVQYVALLRAVNVAGYGVVSIADVRTLYESLGLESVRSYLQSGNLVFKNSMSDSRKLSTRLASAFEERFGFRSETLIRSAEELQKVVALNPWKEFESQPGKLAVMFLRDIPGKSVKLKLEQNFSGPEQFLVAKSEVYLFYPNGMGRSKLSTAYLERQLGTVGTVRNWNTCHRLLAMCEVAD